MNTKYLNQDALDRLSAETFQRQRPYPWAEVRDILADPGFQRLRESLPDVSRFETIVFPKTPYGGVGHDRYSFHYQRGMRLAQPWEEFLAELQAPSYLAFLRRVFGIPCNQRLILTFEWYYAWHGCGVAPHCDARRKLGTHVFYFNTQEDWDPGWGGSILILDDDERFHRRSNPRLADLKTTVSLPAMGNASLLFQRTAHSWHGVHPLQSPPDHLRKIFLCTINLPTWQVWWRRMRGKDPDGYPVALRQNPEIVA